MEAIENCLLVFLILKGTVTIYDKRTGILYEFIMNYVYLYELALTLIKIQLRALINWCQFVKGRFSYEARIYESEWDQSVCSVYLILCTNSNKLICRT